MIENKKYISLILVGLLSEFTTTGCKSLDKVTNSSESNILASPTVTAPATSPVYTAERLEVTGSCNNGYQVNLSGDDTQSMPCTNETYQFKITKTKDGEYQFSIFQTKSSEKRISPSTSLKWIRESSTPEPPSITFPLTSTFVSNSAMTISGRCNAGFEVTVEGDLSKSTPCSSSGTFSVVMSGASDGTYKLKVSQKNRSGIASTNNPTLQWTKNSHAPSVYITSSPRLINLSGTAGFSFSSSNANQFQCNLDGSAFSTCSSPHIFTSINNGMHTFSIKALNNSGTADPSPASYSWSQENYHTVALYHFNSSQELTTDSSLYSPSHQNPLTSSGVSTTPSAAFSQGARLVSSSNPTLTAVNNETQELLSETMTLEAFVNLSSLPANGSNYVIASKTGTEGQYGWEFGITKNNSKYYLYFSGSLNGISPPTTVVSNRINSLSAGVFHHMAVTWDRGDVQFFYNGNDYGTDSIGSKPVLLFSSNAPLRIGSSENGSYMNGTIDELRISRNVRWTADFSVPSAPYAAD